MKIDVNTALNEIKAFKSFNYELSEGKVPEYTQGCLDVLLENYENLLKNFNEYMRVSEYLGKDAWDNASRIADKYIDKEEENEKLKKWVDNLASFLFHNYYKMTYVDDVQFQKKKMEIVRDICDIEEEKNV